MKRNLLLLAIGLVLAISSCNNNPASQVTAHITDSVLVTDTAYVAESDTFSTLDDYETLYIVIADTGTSYYKLAPIMYALNKSINIAIDTMGRYYNPQKNDVVLPDDDDDEIYAGSYFPRRYGEDFLSIENLAFYQRTADSDTIPVFALISGLYNTRQSADSMAAVIKPHQPTVYVLQAEIYMGCMH